MSNDSLSSKLFHDSSSVKSDSSDEAIEEELETLKPQQVCSDTMVKHEPLSWHALCVLISAFQCGRGSPCVWILPGVCFTCKHGIFCEEFSVVCAEYLCLSLLSNLFFMIIRFSV